MRISREDMQKLRAVAQDETLELILKYLGIEVEPKSLLPGITPGEHIPEVMSECSDYWRIMAGEVIESEL